MMFSYKVETLNFSTKKIVNLCWLTCSTFQLDIINNLYYKSKRVFFLPRNVNFSGAMWFSAIIQLFLREVIHASSKKGQILYPRKRIQPCSSEFKRFHPWYWAKSNNQHKAKLRNTERAPNKACCWYCLRKLWLRFEIGAFGKKILFLRGATLESTRLAKTRVKLQFFFLQNQKFACLKNLHFHRNKHTARK